MIALSRRAMAELAKDRLGRLGEIIAHKGIEVAERLAGADLSAAQPTSRSLVAAIAQPGD